MLREKAEGIANAVPEKRWRLLEKQQDIQLDQSREPKGGVAGYKRWASASKTAWINVRKTMGGI